MKMCLPSRFIFMQIKLIFIYEKFCILVRNFLQQNITSLDGKLQIVFYIDFRQSNSLFRSSQSLWDTAL